MKRLDRLYEFPALIMINFVFGDRFVLDIEATKPIFEKLMSILNKFKSREEYILVKRYGLDGGSPQTLESIAKTLGITRERVRQVEAKCYRKMRHPSRASLIRNELEKLAYQLIDKRLGYISKKVESLQELIRITSFQIRPKERRKIMSLDLATRTYNALLRKYEFVDELYDEYGNLKEHELLKIRNFGHGCLKDLERELGISPREIQKLWEQVE